MTTLYLVCSTVDLGYKAVSAHRTREQAEAAEKKLIDEHTAKLITVYAQSPAYAAQRAHRSYEIDTVELIEDTE